jgi:hypothetical protein
VVYKLSPTGLGTKIETGLLVVLTLILHSDLDEETKTGLLMVLAFILLSDLDQETKTSLHLVFTLILLPELDQKTQTGLLLILALILLSDQETKTGLLHCKKRFPTFPSPARMLLSFFIVLVLALIFLSGLD